MSEEREHDPELAERLTAERPVPGAAFRGALGRALTALDPGYGPRPRHLRAAVVVLLLAGVALLAIAAAVWTGGGPYPG